MGKKLRRKFYLNEDTIAVARGLLGKLIVVPDENGRRVSGMIVETEAYLGVTDRAAHSFGGRRTPRNEVTYGNGGYAYVFFIYGMYHQLNVVTGSAEHPHVVLIRAIEPVDGIETMRERRGFLSEPGACGVPAGASPSGVLVATGSKSDKNLTSGPGKLCIALNIDKTPDRARKFLADNGIKSLEFLVDPTTKAFAVIKTHGMPTTLLIDRQGRELGRLVGPAKWDSAEAKALVQAAIAAR